MPGSNFNGLWHRSIRSRRTSPNPRERQRKRGLLRLTLAWRNQSFSRACTRRINDISPDAGSAYSRHLQCGNCAAGSPSCAGDWQLGLKNVDRLTNPTHDAEAVANRLRGIGFQTVTVVHDTTRKILVDALRTFAAEADKADWAMVYYAGHGIEVAV